MAFIRPFEPKDTEDAKFICRATLPPSLAASPEAYAMAPYLWTLQFTHLFPQNCFVLDDGSGKVVGYIIGVPDVFAFADRYGEYVKVVLESEQGRKDVPVPRQLQTQEKWTREDGTPNPEALAQSAYNVDWLVLDGVEGKRELVETYRAMLHIDLLEPFQGKGFGKKMIEIFVDSVKKVASESEGRYDYGKGIQLGVAGENTKVVKFYEKVGFRVYPGGEKEGNVWMVRDF
ncbi:hypothetical protein QBC35DRAFT_498777 [Podospora australis]|uniref:N-acetyltransferase domain-containing protein n=1 Tax=Podospora australis TaxID=1536484 RepID=A0AAN6WU87_9PEZI|nr:hypothetical protein QBC35DRAFT_498777 [Podospora australis]